MPRNPDPEGTPDAGPDIYPPETFSNVKMNDNITAGKVLAQVKVPQTGTYWIDVAIGTSDNEPTVWNNVALFIGPVKVATIPLAVSTGNNNAGRTSGPFTFRFIVEDITRDVIALKAVKAESDNTIIYNAGLFVRVSP